ncbi:MAG TPA: hypothetical protein VFZ75_03120 [Actinomycetota bacterium]|nr:hypothetical protein [Actinomycetota bacterium]
MSVSRSDDAWAASAPAHGRRHRALTVITSVLFVFVISLGQASFAASADQPGTDPATTSAEAPEEVSADEPAAAEEASESAPSSGSAPEEEADAAETDAVETDAAETDAAETDAEATADTDAAATGSSESTDDGGTGPGAETTQVDTPGPASGDGVLPILKLGNPTCAELVPGSTEFKVEPVRDGTFQINSGDLSGTLTVSVNEGAQTFGFALNGDFVALGVIVKGGSNANFYDYRPDGNAADTGLHAPVNPNNGNFYGLSHISFCIGEGEGEGVVAGIDIEKLCPTAVPAGADIPYVITVTNTGTEDLEDVTVQDALLGGNITADFDPDLSAGLAVGASATATFTHDPGSATEVTNTVTASGTGVTSQEDVSDTDDCTTVTTGQQQSPVIDVQKSCPGTVDAGAAIQFTITVTNSGDEDLVDVMVDDSLLGDITGEFDADLSAGLAVGASATAVVTYTPGPNEDPVENTVTATATGAESQDEASDTDSCVTDVLPPPLGGGGNVPPAGPGPGVVQTPPQVSGGTAFTGSEVGIWALVAAALGLIGVAILVATRKGRHAEAWVNN